MIKKIGGHTYLSAQLLADKSGWSLKYVRRFLKDTLEPDEFVHVEDRKKLYHVSHLGILQRLRQSHVLRLEELAKQAKTPKTPQTPMISVSASELRDLKVSITHLQKEIKELRVFEAQMKVVVKALAAKV